MTILRLPAIEHGRSFVVGDVHGAYDLVAQAMRQVGFRIGVDRLYVVGDLVDRGPQSERCSRFLDMPGVFSVRGNHEQIILDMYEDGPPSQAVLNFVCQHNGLGWWLRITEELRQEIVVKFRKLPLVIEVPTKRGLVAFIHGEVPVGQDWDTFKTLLQAGDVSTMEACLWGRKRAEGNDISGVEGVGRLFVGHTPHQFGLQQRGNVYFVDTGAVFGLLEDVSQGHLTMANILTQTASMIAPKQSIGLIEIKDGYEPDQPFGVYTL